MRRTFIVLFFPFVGACGLSDLVDPIHPAKNGPDPGDTVEVKDARCVAPAPSSYIVFQAQESGRLYRVEAQPGGSVEDLTERLDLLGPGADVFLNASPDGDWLALGTTRLGCASTACIAVVRRDACSGQAIVAGAAPVAARGLAAIANGGGLVVYPAPGPAHDLDLFAVRRDGVGWAAPVNLTAASSAPFNQRPAISDDGAHVVFTCGPAESPSAPGTALCEVGVDGSAHRTVSAASLVPGVSAEDAYVGSADYTPSGGLVAEGNLNEQTQLWTIAQAGQASVVAPDVVSDTSPCVLPGGKIASVWGGRDPGLHEIKIADADGANPRVLTAGVDVADVGIGCSR